VENPRVGSSILPLAIEGAYREEITGERTHSARWRGTSTQAVAWSVDGLADGHSYRHG
jgi:hypothetical protein